MKKALIEAGKRYTNGKGNVREVIRRFEQGGNYWADRDWVEYRVVAKKRGPGFVGSTYECTTAAFARWAKRVMEGE